MKKCWRATVAAILLSGTGCCHNCGCCESSRCPPPIPPGANPGPQTYPPAPAGTVPPVGPRPGAGAYGGT